MVLVLFDRLHAKLPLSELSNVMLFIYEYLDQSYFDQVYFPYSVAKPLLTTHEA